MHRILSSNTSEDIERLRDHFKAQETALKDLSTSLQNQSSLPAPDNESEVHPDVSSALQETCRQTLLATEAKRTGQKFGNLLTEDRSIAMQGIVGVRQEGVEQTFGSLTATKESKAFQGQMSSDAFAAMFGSRFFVASRRPTFPRNLYRVKFVNLSGRICFHHGKTGIFRTLKRYT